MKLFTVLFEYMGGTYIRQVKAGTPEGSLNKAVVTLGSVLHVIERDCKEAVEGSNIVPIEGCRNVWATSGLLKEEMLLVHIVETVDEDAVRSAT